MPFKFGKAEHLKSEKSISLLITEGFSFVIFPLKIRWILVPKNDNISIKCGFSVPKRKFKKAVDRNYIKRIMREAYRINKSELTAIVEKNELQMHLLLTFIGDDVPNFQYIESKIILTLQRLIKLNEKSDNMGANISGKTV
jgi:ribonuclease P protein component